MALKLETAPANPVLALDDVKDHLRVTGNDEDDYIASLIEAVRGHFEGPFGLLKRCLVDQTWKFYLDDFTSEIEMPLPPLNSVEHIKYYDTDGVQQTLSTDVYDVDDKSEMGRIVLKSGQSWPAVEIGINKVEIEFIAGYGADDTAIPDDLRHAMLLIIGHYYENREDTAPITIKEIPHGARMLYGSYKVMDV